MVERHRLSVGKGSKGRNDPTQIRSNQFGKRGKQAVQFHFIKKHAFGRPDRPCRTGKEHDESTSFVFRLRQTERHADKPDPVQPERGRDLAQGRVFRAFAHTDKPPGGKVPASGCRRVAPHKDPPRSVAQSHTHGPERQAQGSGCSRRRHHQRPVFRIDIFHILRTASGRKPKRIIMSAHGSAFETGMMQLHADDADDVARLEEQCFSVPWSAEQYRSAFAQRAFLAAGRREHGELVAYLTAYHTPDTLEILNLAVRPDRRRRGHARSLLSTALQAACKTGIVQAVLEVRRTNAPAVALYESLGFRRIGIRRNYYPDTGEDALVYTLDLTAAQPSEPIRTHGGLMRTIIAANWKMYKTREQARDTIRELVRLLTPPPADREILVFAPFTALASAAEACGNAPVAIGAQDVYPAVEGAFTGEISPAMILDAGASHVLTGHSERRHVLGESSAFVGRKTAFALRNGLKTVLCVGETLEERETGRLEAVLREQLETGLADARDEATPERLAVAYEPVWAIGTGKTASPADILEAHALVRTILGSFLPHAADIPLLYGGSVKPDNASSLLALDNVNGLLVGGASLQAESFSRIVRA